jgi:hypothetical protein
MRKLPLKGVCEEATEVPRESAGMPYLGCSLHLGSIARARGRAPRPTFPVAGSIGESR